MSVAIWNPTEIYLPPLILGSSNLGDLHSLNTETAPKIRNEHLKTQKLHLFALFMKSNVVNFPLNPFRHIGITQRNTLN